MPRNVRNFWIEAQIDGRPTKITGGPRAKGGGFVLNIYQRRRGKVHKAIRIQGFARQEGNLRLQVTSGESSFVAHILDTER